MLHVGEENGQLGKKQLAHVAINLEQNALKEKMKCGMELVAMGGGEQDRWEAGKVFRVKVTESTCLSEAMKDGFSSVLMNLYSLHVIWN